MNCKISLIALAYCFFASSAAADECTAQVEAYASGFEMLSGMEGPDTQAAKQELKKIRDLQSRMPDCEVVKNIPPLATNKRAIDEAYKGINK